MSCGSGMLMLPILRALHLILLLSSPMICTPVLVACPIANVVICNSLMMLFRTGLQKSAIYCACPECGT